MAELNKRAATRPATVAKAPAPQQPKFFKWRAKPNAPQAVKDWVDSFDVLRGALISEIDAALEAELTGGKEEESRLREQIGEAETRLAKIKSRPITVRTVRSGAFIQQIADADELAAQKADMKEADDALQKLRRRRAEILRGKFLSPEAQKLAAHKEKLADTSQIPITRLRLIRGRVGYLVDPVTIGYVADERNFVARWGRQTVWISGMDTTGLKNGVLKTITIPVRVTGTKATANIVSTEREMYVLEPFEYAEFVEQAEVDSPASVDSGVANSKPFASIADLVMAMPRSAGDDPLRMTTLQQQDFPLWLEKHALGRGLSTHAIVGDVTPEKGKGITLHGVGTARLENGQHVDYQIQAQFPETNRPMLVALRQGEERRVTGVIKEITIIRPRSRPGATPEPAKLVIVMTDCQLGVI
jgi:hypothetical protein